MPIKVMKNIIGILPDDAIIIDPFVGSGTTCLAVKIMNEEQKVTKNKSIKEWVTSLPVIRNIVDYFDVNL